MCDPRCLTTIVKWTKTIQTRERKLTINLPVLPNHPLCAVTAVINMFRLLGPAEPKSQAFLMKGSDFNEKMRALAATIDGDYSSHSLWWGGVVFALSAGLPGEVVKALGDWKSATYLSYLDQLPQLVLDYYRRQFAQKFPAQ